MSFLLRGFRTPAQTLADHLGPLEQQVLEAIWAQGRPASVRDIQLRVPDQPMEAWVGRLDELGCRNSGVVDRHYFTSVYVREPNHVLFELATEGPGFEVDGPIDPERLSLPPALEPRRLEIERKLRPINTRGPWT